MREQDVRDRDAVLVRGVQQRAYGAARLDHEAVAARRRRHEVGVRQPVRVHRALDDHGSRLMGNRPAPPDVPIAMAIPASASEALVERLFDATVDALELLSVHLGTRLGLYAALRDAGPLTPAGLAARPTRATARTSATAR